LVLIDLVEIDGHFRNLIERNTSIIGINKEQSAIITELAAERQFIRVILITNHFHHMCEHQFGLRVLVPQDIDLVMTV
jgi:hypothetical protein